MTEEPMDRTALVVVHPEELMRTGLCRVLEQEPGLTVRAMLADAQALWSEPRPAPVPLVVLGCAGDTRHVPDSVSRLCATPTRVLVLLPSWQPGVVLRALKAGAGAVLTADVPAAELVRAVQGVLDDGVHHTPLSHRLLMENPDGLTLDERRRAKILAQLRPRALEVLQLICRSDDPTYDLIADELNMSRRTVENDVDRLFEVFGLRSKTAVALAAVRLDIVQL